MKIAWPEKTVRVSTSAVCLGVAMLLGIPTAHAQFNTDALKSMQKEGHKILQEAQAQEPAQTAAQAPARRPYRLQGNLCLDTQAAGLVIRPCDGRASQAWAQDGARRLVAHNGQCVAGAALVPCGAAKNQLWRQDEQKRLVNDAGICLQAQGNPPRAGAKVVAVACSRAVGQVWN